MSYRKRCKSGHLTSHICFLWLISQIQLLPLASYYCSGSHGSSDWFPASHINTWIALLALVLAQTIASIWGMNWLMEALSLHLSNNFISMKRTQKNYGLHFRRERNPSIMYMQRNSLACFHFHV